MQYYLLLQYQVWLIGRSLFNSDRTVISIKHSHITHFTYINNQQMSEPMIKFKLTQTQEVIELAYEPSKTLFDYIDDLSELYDSPPQTFKLVYKGKVLAGKTKAEQAQIKNGTVMVVINAVKKQPKKIVPSSEQVVKGAGMSTGLGASSPFGIGGYEMVNHPQYMSAISQAVDPDKMEQMLNDPQYQGMLEDMLNDPDTLRHLMNTDPMMQNMIKNNPSMKMVLENPALMKMIFNKETLKKTQEMMKNGGLKNPQQMASSIANSNAMFPQQNAMFPQQNPMLAMNQNAGLGGFGGLNPFMNPMMFNANQNPNAPSSNGAQGNPAQVAFQNAFFQRVYASQLKELEQYGFKDRAKNLEVLRQVNGNLDLAIEKLCSQ